MKAKELASQMGDKLIGRWVNTEWYGEWPGGPARVFAMNLDPATPEFVFQVSQARTGEAAETVGIFEYEEVALLDIKPTPTTKQLILEQLTLIENALPNTGPARDAFKEIEQRIAEFEELDKP